jgi:WD40 repeat protein
MDHVESLAFAPDGETIATVGDDRNLRLWDIASGRRIGILEGHAESVKAVAISPDGKTLATGRDDGTMKLWDAPAPGGPKPPAGP